MARRKPQVARSNPGDLVPANPDHHACPFTVVVDSNEPIHGHDYKFVGLRTNADLGGRIIDVPLVYRHLGKGHGDYQVEGVPGFAVERKTKVDLFGSVKNRDNFRERMEIMTRDLRVSCVVVEAELSEILTSPPAYSDYPVKSLLRTIQAWTLRYPTVHWCFLPGRVRAEAWTFRMLEKHWESSRRTEAQ
jgi:ERCC4-type nuclease